MWWVVGVVVVVVLAATYLTWLAGRVDRLHARAVGATSALDAQLVRRAVAAGELADADGDRLGEHAPRLRAAARVAVDVVPADREAAENALTRLLRELRLAADDPAAVDVRTAGRRAALARQVHTDLVRDALGVRRQRVVRLLRLARRHPRPVYFDIDDPTLEEPAATVPRQPAAPPTGQVAEL